MFCIECGVRNPDGAKFCRECGLNIGKVAEQSALLPTRASVALNLERPIATPEESERLRHLLDMAFWHSEAGHLSSARSACEAALKLDPFSSSALSLLGLIYEKQGNIDKAIEIFEKIVAINPGSIADEQKLDALRLGKHQPAVKSNFLYRVTPPALLEITRKYPSLPFIVSGITCIVVLTIGIVGYLHANQPAAALPARSNSTVVSIPSRPSSIPWQVPYRLPSNAPQSTTASAPSVPPYTALPQQNPGFLDRTVEQARQEENRRSDRFDSASAEDDRQMPSIGQLQPLTVPAGEIPTHVVTVGNQQPALADHVVNVPAQTSDSGNGQQDNSGAADNGSSDQSDPDAPAPPASHIIVTIHGMSGADNTNSATPVPTDSGSSSITLRENPGAALQQKGLSLSQAGNYKAAEAAYESAIAEFQQDISNGRNVDEAKRGIDACQVAIQICKQSQ